VRLPDQSAMQENQVISKKTHRQTLGNRCVVSATFIAISAASLGGIMATRLARAEVTATADADQSLYPLCDELVPRATREKYFKGMSILPVDMYSHDTFLQFHRR
jgi:hypothetical protein